VGLSLVFSESIGTWKKEMVTSEAARRKEKKITENVEMS
jgi:hypothetical protein